MGRTDLAQIAFNIISKRFVRHKLSAFRHQYDIPHDFALAAHAHKRAQNIPVT